MDSVFSAMEKYPRMVKVPCFNEISSTIRYVRALESRSNSTARECKNDAISESCSHEKVFSICWSSLGSGSSLWIKLLSAITTGLITIPPFFDPGQKRDAEIRAPAALFP